MLARGELTSGNDHAERQHVDEALAAFGLVQERPPEAPPVFHLWPEHLPALALWSDVQTQWRVGMAGPTGLDYAGVRASPAFVALRRSKREKVFADLCIMEAAALQAWRDKRQ